MRNSFVENSLKRYLKRKVKITLGFMVAFMITGTALFAETQEEIEKMTGTEKAEYYLKGLGESNLSQGEYKDETGNYTITVNENGDISFSGFTVDKIQVTSTVTNNMISAEMKKLLENNILSGENLQIKETETGEKGSNSNILFGKITQNGTQHENKGILLANQIGQYLNWGKRAVNYGIIIVEGNRGDGGGQSSLGGSGGTVENYGIILSKGNGQYLGFNTKDKGNKVYNYGYIKSKNSGQILNTGDENIAYNYGIIYSATGNGQEIRNNAVNSEIRNYGMLTAETQSKFAQSVTGATNSAYNFGIIKGNNNSLIEVKNGAKAYNDGIIINESGTGIFSNDVSNKENVVNNGMVVINGNNITDNFTNDGVVLDSNFEILDKNNASGINKNVVEFANGDSIDNSSVGGEIQQDKTSGYIKNGSVTITESLTDKNINAVITQKLEKPVFTYSGENNFELINTNITGYFKEAGTLLEVAGGEMFTIAGDTTIPALRENGITNDEVVAVNLSTGAVLNVVGEAEIVGQVKGDKAGIGLTAGNGGKDDSGALIAKTENGREVETIIVNNASKDLIESGAVKEENNYTNLIFTNTNVDNFKINFEETAKNEINKIVLGDNVTIKNGIDGVNIKEGNDLSLEINDISTIGGDIRLGASNDSVNLSANNSYEHTIDLGAGEDSFEVKRRISENIKPYEKEEGNTFNYNLMNVENVNLTGGNWYIGTGKLGFTNQDSKSGNGVALNVTNGTLYVEMKGDANKVTTDLDNVVDKGTDLTVSAKSGVKYIIGKDFDVKIGDKFVIDTNYKLGQYETTEKDEETGEDITVQKDTKVGASSIFNTEVDKNGDVVLTVKTAEEVVGEKGYDSIYRVLVENISNDDDLRNKVNYFSNSDKNGFGEFIKTVDETAEAYYTSGYAVTKNITDSFMSAVEDFGRKAGKGEWLAQGKYINSDTEFDGGSKVKGYDGDINSAIGMVEYGVSDTTSYGAVFGGGDTTIDINGGGKLEGDNYYVGAYVKHRTVSGIDLVGNIGYTISELDSSLKNSFAANDNSYSDFVAGTADSTAISFGLKGKKDIYVADNLRLEPNASAKLILIHQDAVTGNDMNFRIDEQDVNVFEGSLGLNVVREYDLNSGNLELSVGVEYALNTTNRNEDARYSLYGKDLEFVKETEIPDNKGTAHVGFDYEHETGFGFNGKYEMMWSDTGDDNRITAGVSYRF